MSKLSKDDLRSPDQIWVASAHGFQWIQSHGARLLILLSLLLVLSVSFFYLDHRKEQQEAKAQAVFGDLVNLMQQWEFATEAAKIESESEIQDRLRQLSESHASSKANHLASIYRAKLAIGKNQLEEGLSHLDHYLKVLPSNQRALGLYPKAIAHESLNQWAEALAHYEEILKREGQIEMKKWALLGKARSLRNMDLKEEAKRTYDQFLSEYPASPEAPSVRGLRARVEK
jgi:tetratricopeptide (TPR) repeat protein